MVTPKRTSRKSTRISKKLTASKNVKLTPRTWLQLDIDGTHNHTPNLSTEGPIINVNDPVRTLQRETPTPLRARSRRLRKLPPLVSPPHTEEPGRVEPDTIPASSSNSPSVLPSLRRSSSPVPHSHPSAHAIDPSPTENPSHVHHHETDHPSLDISGRVNHHLPLPTVDPLFSLRAENRIGRLDSTVKLPPIRIDRISNEEMPLPSPADILRAIASEGGEDSTICSDLPVPFRPPRQHSGPFLDLNTARNSPFRNLRERSVMARLAPLIADQSHAPHAQQAESTPSSSIPFAGPSATNTHLTQRNRAVAPISEHHPNPVSGHLPGDDLDARIAPVWSISRPRKRKADEMLLGSYPPNADAGYPQARKRICEPRLNVDRTDRISEQIHNRRNRGTWFPVSNSVASIPLGLPPPHQDQDESSSEDSESPEPGDST